MKRLLFVLGVAVIAFIIYAILSEESGSPPTPPSSTPSVVQPTPTPQPTTAPTAQPTPVARPPAQPHVSQPVPTPSTVVRTPLPPLPPANPRAAEIEKIIRACAKRAGWNIRRYQLVANGVSRVTGYAPNDNIANQRFLDEIQRSGILRDIETGPTRAYMTPDQRSMLECTLTIKWH